MMRTDHTSILTLVNFARTKTNKPFHFENRWLMKQECNTVAMQSWTRSALRPLALKTKYLAADLCKWRRTKPKLFDELAAVED